MFAGRYGFFILAPGCWPSNVHHNYRHAKCLRCFKKSRAAREFEGNYLLSSFVTDHRCSTISRVLCCWLKVSAPAEEVLPCPRRVLGWSTLSRAVYFSIEPRTRMVLNDRRACWLPSGREPSDVIARSYACPQRKPVYLVYFLWVIFRIFDNWFPNRYRTMERDTAACRSAGRRPRADIPRCMKSIEPNPTPVLRLQTTRSPPTPASPVSSLYQGSYTLRHSKQIN